MSDEQHLASKCSRAIKQATPFTECQTTTLIFAVRQLADPRWAKSTPRDYKISFMRSRQTRSLPNLPTNSVPTTYIILTLFTRVLHQKTGLDSDFIHEIITFHPKISARYEFDSMRTLTLFQPGYASGAKMVPRSKLQKRNLGIICGICEFRNSRNALMFHITTGERNCNITCEWWIHVINILYRGSMLGRADPSNQWLLLDKAAGAWRIEIAQTLPVGRIN